MHAAATTYRLLSCRSLLVSSLLLLRALSLVVSRGFPSGSGGGSSSKSSRPSRLYVGSISYDVTEHQIRELFSIFGPIVELEVPMDPQTGRHKGFAFVEYRTPEEALRAIAETHGKSVWGRNLKVNRPGEPSSGMGGGGMGGGGAGGFNQSAGGSSNVVSEALAAVQARLNPGAMFLPPQGGGAGLGVGASSGGGGPKPGRIYVGNLAYDLTAEHIRQVFSSFGAIRDVTLPLDRDNNNRPKGFVFVEFENEAHAADAMASMNGFELCGRKLRVNGATAQGSGASGNVLAPTAGTAFNASAVAHAQLAASLLQNAGVGANAIGSFGGGLETDGFLSTNAQRAALMDKLSRGAGIGSDASAPPAIDSPILLLKNLVGPGEVDSELEAEVRDEAGQFGAISAVVIHETASHVLIFVQFGANADAAKARASLDKRIFGGKLIRAILYPLAKFQAGIYVPDP